MVARRPDRAYAGVQFGVICRGPHFGMVSVGVPMEWKESVGLGLGLETCLIVCVMDTFLHNGTA